MKRKVVNAGKLRLSPNEEAYILKEDYERRRKLRLLQVREQERGIALQIREDIKQRRNQQLTRLAEELRTEWKESQTQKIKNLEKLYLASLRSMGEGHQQAKENEPDLNALARRAAERRRKAEMRHKEALKLQKNKKEELIGKAAQERVEQCEKAHVRGFQAMKKIHLAQTQEKLMKELRQLQQEDLARRRQTVARMPPQLVELPHKRSEMKEDWQRELEFAFEDMYNADRKVKGNLILHLEPEPLPTVTDKIQDEELDLSMEQEIPLAIKTHQVPSKILFKKLLNRIRSQKSLWTIKSTSEDESEVITTLSETESKAPTVESGATVSEERTSSSGQDQVAESDTLTVDSGPITSEEKPLSLDTDSEKEQEIKEAQPITAVAQSSVLLHPQEEAAKIRMAARQKQIMEIEEQKQKQLELLEQIEQQKLRLETDCFKAQLEEEKRTRTQQTGVGTAPAPCTVTSDEDNHRQMIRNYQQQLLQQNRFHRQSVETARKRLLEYQTMLKGKYSSGLATSLIPESVISVLPQNSERPTVLSEHWDQGQRPKLSPNKYQPVPSIRISKLEQDYFQVPRQSLFPQRQVETDTLITSEVLAKQCLESQEQPKQVSQSEVQQRDDKLIHKDSHALSKPLSQGKLLIIQDPKEVAEVSRATTFQTLDPQQRFSENKESIPSKLPERSSFQPLAAEHAFSSLPVAVESGKIQESFSTMNKSTVSVSHSVISQMQDKSLPTSENITAQLGNLKALQEQLDLQKEVLRSRQEAQERLLLYKQKELEGQTGLSVSLPLVSLESFATLPSARAESGRVQESSSTGDDTAVPSCHLGVPRLPDRLLSFSQPVLSQQDNFKFLQEQLNIQRDSLQARREAQEVSYIHKQRELGGRIWSEQTAPPSLPSQVAQHTFTSLPTAGTHSGKIQEQYSSESTKGLLSSQSENQKPQDGSLSFLQQFLPLHDSLKLLQEQVTTQRAAPQARQEARAELLLRRRRDLGDSKSAQMSSSLPTAVAPCLVASQTPAKTEPGRIQNFYLSGKESVIPSSHPVIPAFQDELRSFPQYNLPRQENSTALQEQSHTQRVMLGAEQEAQEFIHKPHELEKTISSEQTGPSLSLSQVAESERFQELEEHQEWLDTEKAALHFSQKTQGNVSSVQTDSSFGPQLGQPSFTSLPSAESGTTQEPPSTESDGKTLSSHLQIPQLQDRLLRISQLIRPQQDNLKALGERLATQREAILQSRQEAQEDLLLHQQSEWKQRISPEQVGSSSFLSPVVQHSFASLPLSESGRTQEPCSTKSDNTASSRHSGIPGLPDRLLGLSQPVLPQQDHLIGLQQEHLYAQRNSLPCGEKTQKELVLPGQYKFEEELSSEHLVQPHHGDLKVLQEQLEIQRIAIRSRQEAQEELLSQRLSKLEKRVSSEQIGSSLLSLVAPPVADSERIQKPLATRSDSTVPSSHPEIPTSQDRLPSSSQPVVPPQNILTAQLDLQREVVHSNEKDQEEQLLNKQTKLTESESSEHAIPSLFLPIEREDSFIPLPFAEVKSKNNGELYSSRSEHAAPSSNSVIPRFQDRLVWFSQPVLTQQDNLGLQKQLDLQKKVLHYSQRAQEELLVQRQTTLQQQIQKHQETLKDFFNCSQISKPTPESGVETQKLREWLPHRQDLAGDDQEGVSPASRGNSGEHLDKELGRRSSKPPVAKVKCGLDLNQHELSAIPEVESPASGRTSILGKPDFYPDRDPLRVSISREQSFVGSPLNCDAFGFLYPVAQENICGDDSKEAVKVKEAVAENHAVLSHAVEEEHTCLSPAVEPDHAETEEIYHEPLSSVTISTGSFLSYENTDLSLTDPGSFSEPVDPREQESTTGKEDERDILSSMLPSSQVLCQRQDSREIHQPLLPAVEKFTPGKTHVQEMIDKHIIDLDFPELEHTFPNLHRQLFKPLEPHPDFDISSSYSGISQDSRDFYQNSDSSCESHHAVGASRSTVSFTALRTGLKSSNTSLNQQPDPHLAHAATQIFATEKTEGSEQSFQQLLPEFSSQEGSQHVDLPSIFSIEARDSYQGMENQNYSEQTEIQNKKKSVHFHLCVGSLQSSVFSSSDEANVFHPLSLQYSTPCGSTSSECSIRAQPEGRKERLGFEELSERGLDGEKNETHGVLNSHMEEMDSQSCTRTVEMGTSVQAPYSVQNEKYFEYSAKAETPKISRNLSQLAQSELFLSSGSLQSSIPMWETESGHGIMEEPELTLVSTSDISIAEMDFANLTLEENKGNEAKSSSQVSEFLPLVSETETLGCPDVSEHGTEEPVIMSIIALPGSLQEAFIKRKKSFMERSSQRQKEIKNKIRIPENSQIRIVEEKPTGMFHTIYISSDKENVVTL
uniref:Centrosomal protein 295 n=1 Tax=Ursus maritimus TaxID=29073 RepID=A0A452TME5_URSMA